MFPRIDLPDWKPTWVSYSGAPLDPDPLHVSEPTSTKRDRRNYAAGHRHGIRQGIVIGLIVALAVTLITATVVRAATPSSAQRSTAPVGIPGTAVPSSGLNGAPLFGDTSGGAPLPAWMFSPWPTVGVVRLPTASPRRIRHAVSGTLTWYCAAGVSRCTVGHPDGRGLDLYAAAGARLRHALGPDWRGARVRVTAASGAFLTVTLIDWCLCGGDHFLDVYGDAYEWLAERGPVSPAVASW